MTINHIDQLAEWYESAERITKTNLPRSGDYVISPFFNGTGFHVELEPDDWTADIVREEREDARILARAPKPKPAWHDAGAVIASMDYCERQVWERDTTYENRWYGTAGDRAVTSDLREVTPLIEAKVTDEMVKRAMAFWDPNCPGEYDAEDIQWARDFITAALGLETE